MRTTRFVGFAFVNQLLLRQAAKEAFVNARYACQRIRKSMLRKSALVRGPFRTGDLVCFAKDCSKLFDFQNEGHSPGDHKQKPIGPVQLQSHAADFGLHSTSGVRHAFVPAEARLGQQQVEAQLSA